MPARNHILRRSETSRSDVLRIARRMAAAIVRRVETRAASYGPVPLNDSHTLFGNYPMTSTGIRVDNYSATCNIVFRRCCEIIAEGMGKLSPGWQLLDGQKVPNTTAVELALVTEVANHYTTAYNVWTLLFDWSESWGNGYAWILRRRDMTPIGLFPLHPSRVVPRLVRNEDPNSPYPWDLIYQIDGGREIFLPYEILHIKGNPGFDGVTGYNLVQLHENVLAIAQAQEEYAGEFFANGAVAGGLVEVPANLPPAVVLKYQKDFQDKYSSRGNRHKLAVVDSGVKFTETTISPENSQLLESRKFSVYEIALMKGVPPTMLGDLSHGTYNNTEQQQLSFNQVKLHPQCENARQELNMKLAPAGHKWRYDLRLLDAADTTTRTTSIHTAVGGPWKTVEEGREEDGLPAKPEGTIYPPPNMTAPPGSMPGKVGEGNAAAPAAEAEGKDGAPSKEEIEAGETGTDGGANRAAPSRDDAERRFNENHDPKTGEFVGDGGGGGSDVPMHNIKVPKSGKMSIDQANSAMRQMGYTNPQTVAGPKVYDEHGGFKREDYTQYTAPDGRSVVMDARQIKDAVMTGARNYQEAPMHVAAAHAAKWANRAKESHAETRKREEVETRSLKSRRHAAEALAPVMRDAAERLVTKEAKAVSGLTKHLREGHADVFNRKVGEFYDKHQKQVQDSFRPALTALQSAIGRQVAEERDGDGELSDDAAVGVYAKALAGRHVEHAKQAIAEMLTGEKDSTQAADAIDARMKEWQEKKPAGESDYELRQAANFFTRSALKAAGCQQVRWAYAAGDPEECRALAGKTVGIDEPFQEDPLRMHPPLRGECRCGIIGV